jgi:hypothetical protein
MPVWKPYPICKKLIGRDKLKAHMTQPRAYPSKSPRPPPDIDKTPLLQIEGFNEGLNRGVSQEDILDGRGIFSEDDGLAGMRLLVGTMEPVEPIVVEQFSRSGYFEAHQ